GAPKGARCPAKECAGSPTATGAADTTARTRRARVSPGRRTQWRRCRDGAAGRIGSCRGSLRGRGREPANDSRWRPAPREGFAEMNESRAIVDGHCEPAFERVRDALAEALVSGFEVGAALAVYVDGHSVVDLWGGYADVARTRRWERDTIVNLYSIGKAISAVCALRLVDAGLLDLDAPVARYWPEFAQANKGRLPVRYLLTHQAALPAIA